MHINQKYIFIIFLVLFTCFSCEENKEDNEYVQLPVRHIFVPIITDMIGSSPIHLPDGVYYEATVINSKQELVDSLPSDIIASDIIYDDIDYRNYSLLSLKIRCFYKPYKIDYKILKDYNNQVTIQQRLYVSETFHPEGYFIMSNLIIDKLGQHGKISLEQSYSYEHRK